MSKHLFFALLLFMSSFSICAEEDKQVPQPSTQQTNESSEWTPSNEPSSMSEDFAAESEAPTTNTEPAIEYEPEESFGPEE